MKKILIILLVGNVFISCKNDKKINHQNHEIEQNEQKKKKVLSPHTSTMETIGDTHIHIDYSSPGVRNRIIFGGLLAYDQVWQAGAHNATWFEINKEIEIKGMKLPAGKYGFFIIPSKDEWTVIFNSNWDQHGKDEYDQKNDVIRFKVKPITSEELVEHLKYEIHKIDKNSGEIKLSWEKMSIQFIFKVK